MTLFDKDQRRLLVMAMLAALNHRLTAQTEQFLPVLDELVTDRTDREFLHALMLLSLDRKKQALTSIEQHDSEAACALRELICRQIS